MNFYGVGGASIKTKHNKGSKMGVIGGAEKAMVVVDMPGYGHGSHTEWGTEIMKYLQERKGYV